LEAIPWVRSISEVRIYSRNRTHAENLCGAADPGGPSPPKSAAPHCMFAQSVQEAVNGADIIVTATNSKEPILRLEWIAPGAHITAVGSSIAAARELDGATVAASSLFVDRRESTVNESGDFLFE